MNIIQWMKSFLLGRSQRVLVDGVISSAADVVSGVPQGTVLGPLLFLVYINDLPSVTSEGTKVKLFADDSAVYREIRTPQDCLILQKDIDNLQKWEKDNFMEFHPDKCQLLRVTNKRNPLLHNYVIHNQVVQNAEHVKYLGVNISGNLSFNFHIDSICKKAHSTLSFLNRNFGNCTKEIKENLYTSHVRPQVEYCGAVWDPFTTRNINKLEAVQRRAARFVTSNYSHRQSVTVLLKKLNWHPLSERRAVSKVLLFYKARNNLVHIPLDHLHLTQGQTRKSNDYFIPFCRTDAHKYGFYTSSSKLWNSIPVPIRDLNSVESLHASLSNITLRCSY